MWAVISLASRGVAHCEARRSVPGEPHTQRNLRCLLKASLRTARALVSSRALHDPLQFVLPSIARLTIGCARTEPQEEQVT